MQWLPMTFNVLKNIYQTNLVMKLLLPFVNQQFSVQITHFSPFIVSPAYKCEQIIFWFVCVVTFKRAGKASLWSPCFATNCIRDWPCDLFVWMKDWGSWLTTSRNSHEMLFPEAISHNNKYVKCIFISVYKHQWFLFLLGKWAKESRKGKGKELELKNKNRREIAEEKLLKFCCTLRQWSL